MQIITASSAFPKHYYPQAVVLEALERYWGAELENPELLHRLHRNTGVNGCHFALPLHAYPKLSRWGEMNDLWIEVALDLGKQAICRALTCAGLAPRDLGAFFFTSVTGIASPSIDALLINRIGLSPNICRVPMFGLGCVAGAAGIARASDYVKAYPAQLAVLLSVELCSLTIQKEDLSPRQLDLLRTFWRWRGRRYRGGGRVQRIRASLGAARPQNSGDALGVLSPDRRDDGLACLGEGLQ